jgi:hypothetical protein
MVRVTSLFIRHVDFIIETFCDDGADVWYDHFQDLGQQAWRFTDGSEVVVRHVRNDPRSG